MVTLRPADDGSLLIRTDYQNDDAWRAALAAALAPQPQPDGDVFQACLTVCEDAQLDGMDLAQVADLPCEGYLGYTFVADARTMADRTFVVLDLDQERGRSFRCTADQVHLIDANLSIGHVGFFEFADGADADGVFRGYE